jgi:predicted nucleotidyltransferase
VNVMFTEQQKQLVKQRLINSLGTEAEVCRIVIFGSFIHSDDPRDLDVAVFQDSDEKYLPLAMKYRRKTRDIARMIPMDILPLKAGVEGDMFLDEIDRGEVIYERANQNVA